MHRTLPLLLAALAGCATAEVVSGDRCEVRVSEVLPAAAAPGDTVVLTASPLTSHYDTSAWVGEHRALVLDVARTDCAECDACREEQACTACDDCDPCASTCDVTCVETVTFEVPADAAGASSVTVYNAYGVSDPAALSVSGGDDTGASGADDSAAPADSGAADSGRR